MTELKLKISEQELIFKNPLLKGLKGAKILSKIKSYCQNAGTFKLINSDIPAVKTFVNMQMNLAKLSEGSEEYKKALSEAEVYQYEHSELLALASDLMGSEDLLYELCDEILSYYGQTISSDEFTQDDIIQILIWIASEPKNNLKAFLEIIKSLKQEEKV